MAARLASQRHRPGWGAAGRQWLDLAELSDTFLGPEYPTLDTSSHGRVGTMADFPQVGAQGLGSEHLAAAELLTAPMGGASLLHLAILHSQPA